MGFVVLCSLFFTSEDVLVTHDPLQNVAAESVEGVVGGSEQRELTGVSQLLHQTGFTSQVLRGGEYGSNSQNKP